MRHSYGNASPLDEFIYQNEPAGEKESKKFREELYNLIRYIKGWTELVLELEGK